MVFLTNGNKKLKKKRKKGGVKVFNIKNGVIYHTRGDTADFNLTIKINNEPVSDYEAVFSVKRNLKDTDYLFQSNVVNGHVHISHEQTQSLPFGDYYYDIQVRINNGTEEGRYVTIGAYQYHLTADVTTT